MLVRLHLEHVDFHARADEDVEGIVQGQQILAPSGHQEVVLHLRSLLEATELALGHGPVRHVHRVLVASRGEADDI